ncbi:MAG: hypothetical protein RR214_09055 [Synergistaceae bacterium]
MDKSIEIEIRARAFENYIKDDSVTNTSIDFLRDDGRSDAQIRKFISSVLPIY